MAARERRRLGYFAVALPDFVRCRKHPTQPIPAGADSPDCFSRTSTAQYAAAVRQWAASLPEWVTVQMPTTMNLKLDVDAGELEAICLAREIHADAVLMDDRAGRSAAVHCGLAVIGTRTH